MRSKNSLLAKSDFRWFERASERSVLHSRWHRGKISERRIRWDSHRALRSSLLDSRCPERFILLLGAYPDPLEHVWVQLEKETCQESLGCHVRHSKHCWATFTVKGKRLAGERTGEGLPSTAWTPEACKLQIIFARCLCNSGTTVGVVANPRTFAQNWGMFGVYFLPVDGFKLSGYLRFKGNYADQLWSIEILVETQINHKIGFVDCWGKHPVFRHFLRSERFREERTLGSLLISWCGG